MALSSEASGVWHSVVRLAGGVALGSEASEGVALGSEASGSVALGSEASGGGTR